MAEFSVLIVSAQSQERERLEREMARKFNVLVAPTVSAGIASFERDRPHAVVASLAQDTDHGLKLCKTLRATPRGGQVFMVVYGQPRGESFVDRKKVQTTWGIDAFIPLEPEPGVLSGLLWQELAKRYRDVLVKNPEPVAGPAPEPTWKGLLTSDLSSTSLKRLLTRDVGLFGGRGAGKPSK